VKFWDRKKEVEYLKRYIQSEPNAILFVYGPKSSGKSTLLYHVVSELSKRKGFVKKYDVFWYDLRGRLISSYKDVIDIFFKMEDTETGKFISSVESETSFGIPVIANFKIRTSMREEFYSKLADPFEYMEAVLMKGKKRHIIVFDELQRLKDVYINGERKVVDALFNFFVRLTKVLHLAHVIVMSSDTFFIEEIYKSSSLENTSRYYLVDYFDDETTKEILLNEGYSREEANYIVSWIGGVPWLLEEVINEGNKGSFKEVVHALYREVLSKVKLKLLEEKSKNEKFYKKEIEFLSYLMNDKLIFEDTEVLKRLAELEILYYDPINDRITPHTKLHERAIKEVLNSILE